MKEELTLSTGDRAFLASIGVAAGKLEKSRQPAPLIDVAQLRAYGEMELELRRQVAKSNVLEQFTKDQKDIIHQWRERCIRAAELRAELEFRVSELAAERNRLCLYVAELVVALVVFAGAVAVGSQL